MTDDFMMFDTTGDGFIDTYTFWDYDGLHVAHDFNYDNIYDQVEVYTDFNEWGEAQSVMTSIDTDNNGIFDYYVAESYDGFGNLVEFSQMFDYNEDGYIESAKTFTDTTGNGDFDMVSTMHMDNTDSPEIFRVDTAYDVDGDHQADWHMQITGINPAGGDTPEYVQLSVSDADGNVLNQVDIAYEDFLTLGELDYNQLAIASSITDYGNFDPNFTSDDEVSGTPGADMELWECQGNTNRCAVYAQKFAIEAILGHEVPIEELVAVAEEHGWFNDGTTTLNMDKLLGYYGVEHEMSFDNTIDGLKEALDNENKVIVSVDSGQIWFGEANDIFSPMTTADHAVEVIGIDYTDPSNPMVVLNDSGSPTGCGELVPLNIFENAWNAGDAQMIVCYA